MLVSKVFKVACAAAVIVGFAIPAASAGDSRGSGFLRFEFGRYLPSEPAWRAGGISCKSGKRIVWKRGFRSVDPVDCHGYIFTYVGTYRGGEYRVVVNALSGRIIGVARA